MLIVECPWIWYWQAIAADIGRHGTKVSRAQTRQKAGDLGQIEHLTNLCSNIRFLMLLEAHRWQPDEDENRSTGSTLDSALVQLRELVPLLEKNQNISDNCTAWVRCYRISVGFELCGS